MKGGHGQEPSDGRKNRPGKLNYIAANKYKILTFVLAALVITNATGLTGWIVDRKTNFPVVLWAGSGSSGGGSVCDGLNKGQCDSHGCCEWYGSKSSGECQFDCGGGTPYCHEEKEKCVECLSNSSDGKPNDCYKCVDGSWEKKANPFDHECVECEDGKWVERNRECKNWELDDCDIENVGWGILENYKLICYWEGDRYCVWSDGSKTKIGEVTTETSAEYGSNEPVCDFCGEGGHQHPKKPSNSDC